MIQIRDQCSLALAHFFFLLFLSRQLVRRMHFAAKCGASDLIQFEREALTRREWQKSLLDKGQVLPNLTLVHTISNTCYKLPKSHLHTNSCGHRLVTGCHLPICLTSGMAPCY